MSKKEVRNFIVTENRVLNDSSSLIRLQSELELPIIKPGQFLNLEVNNCNEIFLRRPFSFFEIDYHKRTIAILVKILGRGSKKLTEIQVKEKVSIVFPLGKEFTLPVETDHILLVGGGSGIAPMLFLAKESGILPENVHILLGAKTKSEHIDIAEYKKYGQVYYSTDDGSFGENGFVTQHSLFKDLKKFTKIYACGPDGMMKAVAEKARINNVFCEVSLENMMACGFGVCLCCIEPTLKGNLCVCTDGPVFNINELKWQI